MLRSIHAGRITLPYVLIGAILAGGFVAGIWTGRRSQAAGAASPSTNREVSQKLWVSAQEIKDRFPAAKHNEFMRKAIANSRMAGVDKKTGGAFGAVIVDRNGKIVGEGSNQVVKNFDPTWHGEMEAFRNACANLKVLKLDGCILYTSAEPCPMCLATAYWAGVDGVVFGAFATDSKKYGGFDDVFIYEEFLKTAKDRSVPEIQILRDEAVTVWKEYASQTSNVAY